MSKFKIGDVVIGNERANVYSVTRKGVKLQVIETYASDMFKGEVLAGSANWIGRTFNVFETCFDLCERNVPTIVITCDGKTTTATLKDGKKVLRRESVSLYHEDEFDHFTGAEYALKKLFDKPLTDGPKEKEQYYTAKVVCIDNCGYKDYWTTGKIYEVKNGCVADDTDIALPYGPYKSLEHMNKQNGAKFLEIKE